jgi:phage tail sheath protein FI
VIANSDKANGYWWSPSNQPIPGVIGLSRPVSFSTSDATADSNLLNAAGVATIVNSGGYRLWGNRTGDPNTAWQFLSVRRTFDVIEDAVEASYQWALDRPFSAGLLTTIEANLNAFLRSLKAKGAIIDGKCWLDPDLNTAQSLAAGEFYVDFDAEPAAPLDRLTFQAQRNAGYYAELLSQVASASGSSSTTTTS